MERLFAADEIQKKIAECRIQEIITDKSSTVFPHEPLYSERRISRFVDPISEEEVALIADYVKLDQTKSSVICRLRIGNTIYEREVF